MADIPRDVRTVEAMSVIVKRLPCVASGFLGKCAPITAKLFVDMARNDVIVNSKGGASCNNSKQLV